MADGWVCPECGIDYDTLAPGDLAVAIRSYPRRFRAALATLDEDTAWAFLTSDFARMSLFPGVPLEANAEYYVRVRANSSPKNSTFIWPWQADDAVGLAKFTFIR